MNPSKYWKFFINEITYDKIMILREYLQENAEYYDISRVRQSNNEDVNYLSLSGNVTFSRRISPPEIIEDIKWIRLQDDEKIYYHQREIIID